MTTWLERYRAGEREQVWAEMCACGALVREEPLFGAARAGARETMQRAKSNVERVVTRLRQIGYRFAFPDEAYVPAGQEAQHQIAELEMRVGTLPLSLRAWYEIVGSVNLMGAYPGLDFYSDKSGLVPDKYPDPLVILPIEAAFDEYQNAARDDDAPFFLPLAPDKFHKENVSGGSPYGIEIPSLAIDAPLENERHHTTFVDYLQICFRWGGFPGWARYPERPDGILQNLARDLLPLR